MATSDVATPLAGAELDNNQETCPRCGRSADEVCFSDAAGERCCADCHCRAADAVRTPQERNRTRAAISRHQATVRRARAKPHKPLEESAYARMVRKFCARLEDRTGMRPSLGLDGTGTIGAYCPTRCGGLLVVRFVDGHPPEARLNAGFPDFTPNVCSRGCPEAEIDEALQ